MRVGPPRGHQPAQNNLGVSDWFIYASARVGWPLSRLGLVAERSELPLLPRIDAARTRSCHRCSFEQSHRLQATICVCFAPLKALTTACELHDRVIDNGVIRSPVVVPATGQGAATNTHDAAQVCTPGSSGQPTGHGGPVNVPGTKQKAPVVRGGAGGQRGGRRRRWRCSLRNACITGLGLHPLARACCARSSAPLRTPCASHGGCAIK